VLRQVVDRALLADIAAASNALIDSDATQHLQRDAFTGSLIPVTKSSAFLPLITHAPTLDALAAAGLGDARWLSGYVISKPPSSPSLGWHQDAWYWAVSCGRDNFREILGGKTMKNRHAW